MWNDGKSILLSRICVLVFLAVLVAVAVAAPWLVNTYMNFPNTTNTNTYFLLTIYAGCVPALLLLINLFSLLRRIDRGAVFVHKNVNSLRYISWCCFAGAAISATSMAYYVPWATVAVAAAFMGLVVRVVKNVFSRAVALQDDADHTI